MAVINTNVASLNAQNNLMKSQNDLQTSLQRLSSGLRINSAKDDAAGLAISDRMTAQIRGLNQAQRNANDGISLAQTAEGAMSESTNILQRMRELAIQSANDTNSDVDRANLQKEVSQLQQELNRISETTTFNGKNILDGSFTSAKFQVGANSNETINVSIGSTSAQKIGAYQGGSSANIGAAAAVAADISAGNEVAADTLTINGYLGSEEYAVAAGATAKNIAEGVNGLSGGTGVTASARTETTISGLSADGTVTFDLSSSNGAGAVNITAGVTTSDLSNLSDAINAKSGETGIFATLSDDKTAITLTNEQGEDINIQDLSHSAGGESISVAGQAMGAAGDGSDGSIVVGGEVSFESNRNFNVSAAANTDILAAPVAGTLSAVSDIDIGSQSGSNDAISVIDKALSYISEQRADLGAVQNRFESTIANLASISENVSAARSRIQDADFAQETANLTRNQILQQAGTSILAQANQLPQQVLSLLG
ncbi:flagellin [Marinobacterium sp. 3-1745]|uniref:Flagellin n=2 Tax=Marinobacterium marinum TaxID=2756129 RepID=A0A7W1WVJ7_9GAMM|nr:flagellin [Marinobacterium marinum]